jgi:hypothetical protein
MGFAALVGASTAVAVSAESVSAAHYHTTCVGHGFVHGSSTTDNAMHSRIEAGCGNWSLKRCRFYHTEQGGFSSGYSDVPVNVAQTCDHFIPSTAGYGEQSAQAHVLFDTAFTNHAHFPH